MQLKERSGGSVRKNIAAISASLLAATITTHPDTARGASLLPNSAHGNQNNNFGPGVSYSELEQRIARLSGSRRTRVGRRAGAGSCRCTGPAVRSST